MLFLYFLAPSKPPMNLTGHFMDHISIEMKWTRVPKEHRQGIIEGYKLYYKDKTIPDGPWHNVIVPNRQGGSDLFNKTVTGLRIYTPYVFRIQAFTYKADGVFSENITVWTDEYGTLLLVHLKSSKNFLLLEHKSRFLE